MTGCKIYQMTVKIGPNYPKLVFRDSWLIMQVPLDDLKNTFNLQCENEMFFPYLWNCKKNMNTKLEHLPPLECYIPGAMKDARYKNFFVVLNLSKICTKI